MANIYLYDESNQPSGCVELTNLIATCEDYDEIIYSKYIHLAWPECTLQLVTFHCPTHIVLEHVTTTARTVFEVTSFDSLGGQETEGTLVQFHMTVDYIRDYWLNFADANGNYILHRTTDSTYWNKWLTDDTYTILSYATPTSTMGNDSMRGSSKICVLINACGQGNPDGSWTVFGDPESSMVPIILRDADSWHKLRSKIMQYTDLANAVKAAWIVPNWVTTGYHLFEDGTIQNLDYLRIFGEGGITSLQGLMTAPTTVNEFGYGYIVTGASGTSRATEYTGLSVSVDNWLDVRCTNYVLRVPYLGNMIINPINAYGSLSIMYMPNLYEGTVTGVLCTNNDVMHWDQTLAGSFPEVMIPNSSAPTAIRNLATNMATGAVPAVLGGAMIGGIGGTVVGVGAMLAGGFMQASDAMVGSVTYSTAGNYTGRIDNRYALTTIKMRGAYSMAEHGARRGYLSDTTASTLSSLPRGHRHWLDVSSATFYGNADYANSVRSAYHNTPIYIPE